MSATTAGVAFWGEVNNLTEAELALLEAEGYEALGTKRRAELDVKIASSFRAGPADQ